MYLVSGGVKVILEPHCRYSSLISDAQTFLAEISLASNIPLVIMFFVVLWLVLSFRERNNFG